MDEQPPILGLLIEMAALAVWRFWRRVRGRSVTSGLEPYVGKVRVGMSNEKE